MSSSNLITKCPAYSGAKPARKAPRSAEVVVLWADACSFVGPMPSPSLEDKISVEDLVVRRSGDEMPVARNFSGASGPRPKAAWAGYAACVLALGHAAVSFYWASGGTAGLSTVGGELEAMGRAGSPALAAVVWGGSALLALYGGVLVAVEALVVGGIIVPSGPVDWLALRWHLFLWDPWFFLWGVLLGVAAWHYTRGPRAGKRTEKTPVR